MKRILIVIFVLLIGGGAAWFWLSNSNHVLQYRFARVERGSLSISVTATGSIQPVTQVIVGSQVSGVIQKLHADFSSRVKAGQPIAQIDPAPFEARVQQDEANLARALAEVERVKANLAQAEKELVRSRELARRELISPSELDADQAAYHSLLAQLKVAKAGMQQSKAALKVSQVNLEYTTIVSPIDGIVISRNVEVGQTVAASFSSPTLFVITDNLKKILVHASVPEADLSRIFVGQKSSFTVDAYRDTAFDGAVSQIRPSPTVVQNVVTYTVLIEAESPEEKLLRGMTANVTFEVAHHENCLKIPNAALRFNPPPDQVPKEILRAPKAEPNRGRVWIATPEGPRPVPVTIGESDGSFTRLVEGPILEKQELMTGIISSGSGSPLTNPFAPSRRGR